MLYQFELLACTRPGPPASASRPYFPSLWTVCFRQNRQNFLNSSFSDVFFLFLVVE